MSNYEDLIRLGLTEGEAKTYISLLELGTSTVGPISKKSGVAYSNIYGVLDRLIKKGLASFIIKEKTKYFQAASPAHLEDYLTKKKEELEKQKESLKNIIPRISQIQNTTENQDAEIFIGTKGLRSAYEKFFSGAKRGEEYRFFYIYDEKTGEKSDLFYFSIIELMKKTKLKIRGITNEYGRKSESNNELKKKKLAEFKYVDFPIPANIEFYGKKVMIISWDAEPTAILINSKNIAGTLTKYFDSVWKVAKK